MIVVSKYVHLYMFKKQKFFGMRKLLGVLALFFIANLVSAQIIEPIKWSFDAQQDGRNVALQFQAVIDEDWHLYDTKIPEGGPIATSIVFEDSTKFEFAGELEKEPQPEIHFDSTFQMNLGYFSDKVTLTQNIRLITDEPVEISGYVLFMGCDDETCLPPNEAEFSFTFNGSGEQKEERQIALADNDFTSAGRGSASGQTLWLFIIISALAGLAAIFTPCVFPMIPMTVSFFMRGSDNRGKAIRSGLFFGISILLIFTLLGALFSFGVFGPNVGSILSTHWIPNLLFFLLFLIFSISFFGAFEIILPNRLVNKTDSKAGKGGFAGAFFMALTTVIVSFSCTGPFIGALIIEAVQDGGMRPLIGMFFFGLAFAAPFTLLAIFPSALSKLPKSGGWLNSVKVVFAFILLAFGFKFLSNIDQVYGLQLISREVYLSIWIVIFFILGLYFLGKIKFSHDSDLPYVGVGRLFLSIATFTFVIYLFTGLLGAPLTSISSLLPPQSERHLYQVSSSGSSVSRQEAELCGPARYAGKFHLPHGLEGYFDYEQGMACAQELGKPAFVVFKGHACANCKKMENTVWADPRVLELLSEEYVIIALYTDDRTALPEDEQFTFGGREVKTLGKKNLSILVGEYQTNSIPFHVIIEPDGTRYRLGVTFEEDVFLDFLKMGI